MHRISRSQPACDRRLQLQFAETPSWRVKNTLRTLYEHSIERVEAHAHGVESTNSVTPALSLPTTRNGSEITSD